METKTKEQVKLVSMREFVLEQFDLLIKWKVDEPHFILRVNEYAKFLSTPLQLGHFIPCNLDGVVLSEPESWQNFLEYSDISVPGLKPELYEYAEAKSRVLFEGFSIRNHSDFKTLEFPSNYTKDFSNFNDAFYKWTIETLITHNLTLTQTAKEMFNLK